MIYRLGNDLPELAESCYVADSAQIIGKVRILQGASIWMGAVLRGDIEQIVVGCDSNVQENCSLHTSNGLPLIIGEQVTVGHGAILHSCTIGDNSLIGMNATLLDGAKIGNASLVAAGSLVAPGSCFPDNSMIMGQPAKWQKELSRSAQEGIRANTLRYSELAKLYRSALVPLQQNWGRASSRRALNDEYCRQLGEEGVYPVKNQELPEQQWKLVVYIPQQLESSKPINQWLENIKEALFQAGAGHIGLYSRCSWQSNGQGQFQAQEGSRPFMGNNGQLSNLEEYKLELLCPVSRLKPALDALYQAHPYQSPAYEIYPVYGPAQ